MVNTLAARMPRDLTIDEEGVILLGGESIYQQIHNVTDWMWCSEADGTIEELALALAEYPADDVLAEVAEALGFKE